MRRGLKRFAVPQKQAAQAVPYTFVAPVRGWVTNENMAAAGRGGALILDNWFPTQAGIRVRKGSELYATIGSAAVESLFTYVSGSTKKFFAADATDVYDITTVADASTPPTADVSSQTSGEYSTVQFETSGGDYLYIVNGADKPQLYDGSSWTAIDGSSTPAITGVTTSSLSSVWVYRSRIYFVEKDSTTAWYLPVDSVGGAASDISLAGVFQKGGNLLFGSTWSLDSGNGLDDKCVFVSDLGEVAVYQGSYPGGSDWSLVGRYDITDPKGKNAYFRAGGDLLIATKEGIVPISQAVRKDVAALSLAAITRAIEKEWKAEVEARTSNPWQIAKWDDGNMAIVSLPVESASTPARCFVTNLQTGAWCRYTGWNTHSLGVHDGSAYYGTNGGEILKCETGGNDDGSLYTASYVGLFDHVKSVGANKVAKLARATFLATRPFDAQISLSANYQSSLPTAPSAYVANSNSNNWDVGKWDVALWSGDSNPLAKLRWRAVSTVGFALAPQIQISVSQSDEPGIELASFDIVYENAGVVI